MNSELQFVAKQFSGGQKIIHIGPLGNGLINATYLVVTGTKKFVLQRINQQVFRQPECVMSNLLQLHRHIGGQTAIRTALKIPKLLLSGSEHTFYLDAEGQYWRALELIQPAESREHLNRHEEAAQIGWALAHFHRLFSQLPISQLHDTLPGFHITPNYFSDYQSLNQMPPAGITAEHVHYCQQFIASFTDKIDTLERARLQGELIERVIHGDPKLNNFLFIPDSDKIVSLIDLDTVKPGLVHYDIGDCLRSCCHIAQDNQFNLDYCQTILASYLLEAGQFFTPADYEYLYPAIQLIPFELGLRFFSDFLRGNLYFKVSDPQQNLRRAVAQFQLTESITAKRTLIEKMITQLRKLH